MATIRSDFEGTVLAVNSIGQSTALVADDTIPDGYFVGGHALEDGDPDDQVAPWDNQGVHVADIVDATEVGAALLAAEDAAAAQTALGATDVGKALLTAEDAAAGRTAIGAAEAG